MGGGTSAVSKYPPESLDSAAAGGRAEGLLTREMLDNLAGAGFSPGKRPSRRGSGFAKSYFNTPGDRQELPPNVSKLLLRIGITSPDVESELPEQKSKLVAHIFECLGALQSLVNVSDLSYDPEMETQSVCERDTMAMGTLLHEMVSIYGLCGDTLAILLASNPAAATIEDSVGRLPLHVACDCDEPWLRTVRTLLEAYPRACRERDGAGRLPLHVIVDRSWPCVDTMRLLLDTYPEAAGIRRGVGRLAIHYACFCESPSPPAIRMLLAAHPLGAGTADLYGRLPLHYLLDHSARPNIGAVQELLRVYPEGARMKDTSGKYPLTIALEREHEVALIQVLYDAYPRVVLDAKDPDRSLLHAYVEVIARPRVDVVRYIIAADKQLTGGNACKDSDLADVLKICREKALHEVEREVLRSFDQEPARLGELRWMARKHALLIANCSASHEIPTYSPRVPVSPGGQLSMYLSGPPLSSVGNALAGRNILKATSQNCKRGFEEIIMFL